MLIQGYPNGKSGKRDSPLWNPSKHGGNASYRYRHKAHENGRVSLINILRGRTGLDGGESLNGCSGLANLKTKPK